MARAFLGRIATLENVIGALAPASHRRSRTVDQATSTARSRPDKNASHMNHPRIVIETNVDPAAAFAFVADPVNEPKWNPRATRAEKSSPPPVGVGSTFTIIGKMVGREMKVDVVVTELDPPRLFSTRASSGPMRFDTTYVVEPTGSGASITMSVAVAVEGPLRLATPLIREGFGRRLSGLAPRLKAAIEAYPTAGEASS